MSKNLDINFFMWYTINRNIFTADNIKLGQTLLNLALNTIFKR